MLEDNYRYNIQPKQPQIPLLKRYNEKDKKIFKSQNKFEVLADLDSEKDINYTDDDELITSVKFQKQHMKNKKRECQRRNHRGKMSDQLKSKKALKKKLVEVLQTIHER